jgi:site-specific DNA-methyltransferase (adenine-specific)
MFVDIYSTDKKYQVIYADPPWDVKKIKRECRPNQVEFDYPTMSLEAISELPVKSLSDTNAVCFLWTTHKYLPYSFDILEAWGFKYQRTLTWDKGNGMCLFGFHHCTEFLLFGYKGKIDMYPKRKVIPTLIVEHTWRSHSRKPQSVYNLISVFGGGIELFARQEVEGWDCWGNETTKFNDVVNYPKNNEYKNLELPL